MSQAVSALKGARPGVVRVGVAKPMVLPEAGESSTDAAEPLAMVCLHASRKVASKISKSLHVLLVRCCTCTCESHDWLLLGLERCIFYMYICIILHSNTRKESL